MGLTLPMWCCSPGGYRVCNSERVSDLLERGSAQAVPPSRRRRWVLIGALAVLTIAAVILTIAISPFANAAGFCGGG